MAGDWGFVVWIVLAAVPIGLLMISRWSRAKPPGESRMDEPNEPPGEPRS